MSYGPGTYIKFRFENNVAYKSFLLFFTVFLFYYHLAINVYADFWIISRACIHAHHTHIPHFSHLALGVGIPIVLV